MQISSASPVSTPAAVITAETAAALACAKGTSTFNSERTNTGEIRQRAQSTASRWRVQLDDLTFSRNGHTIIATATFCGGVSDARNAAKFF